MENTVRRLVRGELRFRKMLAVLEYARECGSNAKAWREFKVPKSTFYRSGPPKLDSGLDVISA
jgi:hypothetical protein